MVLILAPVGSCESSPSLSLRVPWKVSAGGGNRSEGSCKFQPAVPSLGRSALQSTHLTLPSQQLSGALNLTTHPALPPPTEQVSGLPKSHNRGRLCSGRLGWAVFPQSSLGVLPLEVPHGRVPLRGRVCSPPPWACSWHVAGRSQDAPLHRSLHRPARAAENYLPCILAVPGLRRELCFLGPSRSGLLSVLCCFGRAGLRGAPSGVRAVEKVLVGFRWMRVLRVLRAVAGSA